MPPNLIPHPDGGQMLPPLQYPDAHSMTLEEIEQHFVTGAPYEAERQAIFKSLVTYCEMVWRLIPEAELWVNGGFCTLKDWAAPSDVDVAFTVPPRYQELIKYDDTLRLALDALRTKVISPGKIYRPMRGDVDGYALAAGRPPVERKGLGLITHEEYWHQQWSNVKAQDGTIHPEARKGFIKVVNPWIL